MTIEEWAKDFKSYVNEFNMPRDDYKGIMEYIDDTVDLLKEWETEHSEWITIWQEDDQDTSRMGCRRMMDIEKVIKGIGICLQRFHCGEDCPYFNDTKSGCMEQLGEDVLSLLKEQGNEYENGFNDAMLGKQELMYEGTDGKWHKKDW